MGECDLKQAVAVTRRLDGRYCDSKAPAPLQILGRTHGSERWTSGRARRLVSYCKLSMSRVVTASRHEDNIPQRIVAVPAGIQVPRLDCPSVVADRDILHLRMSILEFSHSECSHTRYMRNLPISPLAMTQKAAPKLEESGHLAWDDIRKTIHCI